MIQRRKRQRQVKTLFFVFAFIGFIVAVSLLVKILHHPPEKKQNPLQQIVQNIIHDKDGRYGIVIANLKTGEAYKLNNQEYFPTGSMYKLWVMGAVMGEIENNKIKRDDIVSDDVVNLNAQFHIAPEDADLTEGTVTLSISDALNQMITISHNYAALLLTQKIGEDALSQYLTSYGLMQSHLHGDDNLPAATPDDIALFFDKLYTGKLANNTISQQMIDLLKAQQLNEKLPKYLPGATVIAHKTGELDFYSHDGGIVYAPFGTYIIVVMTKSAHPENTNEVIAKISQSVYAYFSKTSAEK